MSRPAAAAAGPYPQSALFAADPCVDRSPAATAWPRWWAIPDLAVREQVAAAIYADMARRPWGPNGEPELPNINRRANWWMTRLNIPSLSSTRSAAAAAAQADVQAAAAIPVPPAPVIDLQVVAAATPDIRIFAGDGDAEEGDEAAAVGAAHQPNAKQQALLNSLQARWQVNDQLQPEPILLTGGAGVGKSFTIHQIIAMLKKRFPGPCTRSHPAVPAAADGAAADPPCACFYCAVAIIGPTGMAVLPLSGRMLHSFLGVNQGATMKDWTKAASDFHRPRMLSVRVLIVEEVSMVSAEWMDLMDARLRRTRKDQRPFGGVELILLGDFSQLPPVCTNSVGTPERKARDAKFDVFRDAREELRAQMALYGLAEVAGPNVPFLEQQFAAEFEAQNKRNQVLADAAAAALEAFRALPIRNLGYAFQANVWLDWPLAIHELTEPMRQQQGDAVQSRFVQHLNEIRTGLMTQECVAFFSSRVQPHAPGEDLHISYTKKGVARRNTSKLQQLEAAGVPVHTFPAMSLRKECVTIAQARERQQHINEANGLSHAQLIASEASDKKLEELASHKLQFCQGAEVMLTRNLRDTEPNLQMLVNGSRGKVIGWKPLAEAIADAESYLQECKDFLAADLFDSARAKRGAKYRLDESQRKVEFLLHLQTSSVSVLPIVQFYTLDNTPGRILVILPVLYALKDVQDSEGDLERVFNKWRVQLPLVLAWALTAHKSQGMSLDGAHILNSNAFAYGQLYVALSRVRYFNKLTLASPINASVLADPKIVAFTAAASVAAGAPPAPRQPVDWFADEEEILNSL